MREINPRPGACVCIGRWNGDILMYKPQAYSPIKQGDSEGWAELRRRHDAHDKQKPQQRRTAG